MEKHEVKQIKKKAKREKAERRAEAFDNAKKQRRREYRCYWTFPFGHVEEFREGRWRCKICDKLIYA